MKIYIVKECEYSTYESIMIETIMSIWIDYNDAEKEKERLKHNNNKSWIWYDIGIYTVEEKRDV